MHGVTMKIMKADNLRPAVSLVDNPQINLSEIFDRVQLAGTCHGGLEDA